MSLILSTVLFLVGLGLVLYFAEKLVQGVVGTSVGFGVSSFIISVVFIGFDPENLAVGAVGTSEGASGIALGSIVGAAMVAIGLAFGLTALISPMHFGRVPRSVLSVPILAVLLFGGLAWDGLLSRLDGLLLLVGFTVAVVALIWMSRKGIDIQPAGEVAETLEKKERLTRWKSLALFAVSLVAIIAGSEMLVAGSKTIVNRLGLSETFFGMVVLALLVSIEEVARELPAALNGRPEITYGNVVGSILAFFCFNAGIIALVQPVPVEPQVSLFYLPICGVTALVTTAAMIRRDVSRWVGAILVLLYVAFALGGYAGLAGASDIRGLV